MGTTSSSSGNSDMMYTVDLRPHYKLQQGCGDNMWLTRSQGQKTRLWFWNSDHQQEYVSAPVHRFDTTLSHCDERGNWTESGSLISNPQNATVWSDDTHMFVIPKSTRIYNISDKNEHNRLFPSDIKLSSNMTIPCKQAKPLNSKSIE